MQTHVPVNWTCEGTSVLVRIMGENFKQYNNKKNKRNEIYKKNSLQIVRDGCKLMQSHSSF